MKIADIEWWQNECRNLFFFETVVLREAWSEKFHDFGQLQHDMCDFLDPALTPGQRKCLSVDRHSYKTTVLHGFLVWLFIWSIQEKSPTSMVYNTATKENTEAFGQEVKHTLENCDLLHNIFPGVIPRARSGYTKLKKNRIQVGETRFDFASFEEQQVFRHYKIMANDDLVNDTNVKTEGGREESKRKWKFQKSIVSKSRTKMSLELDQGTPYDYRDLMWEIITRNKSYLKFIRACIEGWPDVSIADVVHKRKPLTDPENKTYEHYIDLLEDQGSSIFSSQSLIKPLLENEALCLPEWIVYYDRLPEVAYRTMVMDLGGSDPEEHDPTGVTVVDTDENGDMYIVYADELWLSPMNIIEKTEELLKLYKPDDARFEKEKYSITIGDFCEHLLPKYNIGFLSHHKQDKSFRIWKLRPWLEKKKIKIKQEMKMLEEQLLGISPRDDIKESLAYHLDIRQVPARSTKPKFIPEVEPEFDKEIDRLMKKKKGLDKAKDYDQLY